MEVGEVYRRVNTGAAGLGDGDHGVRRPVGERIRIEELVRSVYKIDQARFEFIDGPNKGCKDQWAISAIDAQFTRDDG